jgi:hypothetical protein
MPTVNTAFYVIIRSSTHPQGYAFLFPYLDNLVLFVPEAVLLPSTVEVPTAPPLPKSDKYLW